MTPGNVILVGVLALVILAVVVVIFGLDIPEDSE